MRVLRATVFILFAAGTSSFAAFSSAVIALDFPAGAENTGLGETGVSHAKSLYSLFWNPATLPGVYDETFSNVIFTSFREPLWPALNLPDMQHSFTASALLLNDVFPHVDIGYGYFKNHIDFGRNAMYDSLGDPVATFNSDETVTSNSLALRVFDIFSLGVSDKWYDSRLAPGMGGAANPREGTATGRAYDLGFLLTKAFDIRHIVKVQPSLGISFLNLHGDSAWYVSDSIKDPLPKMMIYGGSIDVDLLDWFGLMCVYEKDRSLLYGEWKEVQRHYGFRLEVTPFFYYVNGALNDTLGRRYERDEGYVLTFNVQKTLSAMCRLAASYDRKNQTNYSARIRTWQSGLTFEGFTLKPNLYLARAHSEIHSQDTLRIRDHQTRDDFTVGIGLLGSFSRRPQGKVPAKGVLPLPKPPASVAPNDTTSHGEDGDLVE